MLDFISPNYAPLMSPEYYRSLFLFIIRLLANLIEINSAVGGVIAYVYSPKLVSKLGIYIQVNFNVNYCLLSKF